MWLNLHCVQWWILNKQLVASSNNKSWFYLPNFAFHTEVLTTGWKMMLIYTIMHIIVCRDTHKHININTGMHIYIPKLQIIYFCTAIMHYLNHYLSTSFNTWHSGRIKGTEWKSIHTQLRNTNLSFFSDNTATEI